MQFANDKVTLAGLSKKMRVVLTVADKVWAKHGQELVVTSGLDGCHSAGSLHYYGEALDFRTKYFDDLKKLEVFAALKAGISDDFDVVFHRTHIHVEYDPK